MAETPSTKPPRDNAESRELLRTSGAARQIERRLFLKQGLSIGALTLLTGCDVTDTSAVQSVLDGISRWNDRAQALIFNPRRLMPTYPARGGFGHGGGFRGGFVRNPTTLLGSPAPRMPAFQNRIPAPLAAPTQAPVINGPAARSPYGGVL